MFNKVKKVLKNPRLLVIRIVKKSIFFKIIPDSIYLKFNYKLRLNKSLNLNNPQTFNEKLQWLKIHDRRPEYTQFVDKYRVRRYIEETIGEDYLIPLLGVYDSYEDINFNTLPNQFVLKPNHTSGDVYICKDKSKIDHKKLRKKIMKWLKKEYFWAHREWPYKEVQPRIICEKHMKDESGLELKDYKFMCFNGELKSIFACLNRYSESGLNIDIYDKNWNLMPYTRKEHPNSGIRIPKPKNLQKMIDIAEKLSKDITFLRVDFYEVNGQLYFGELTLYPGAGYEKFKPEKYDYILGSWMDLPKK